MSTYVKPVYQPDQRVKLRNNPALLEKYGLKDQYENHPDDEYTIQYSFGGLAEFTAGYMYRLDDDHDLDYPEDIIYIPVEIPTSIEIFPLPDGLQHPIDNIEMQPVWVEEDVVEVAPRDEDAVFWSVYVHFSRKGEGQGVQCVADCPTKEDALKVHDLLLQVLRLARYEG